MGGAIQRGTRNPASISSFFLGGVVEIQGDYTVQPVDGFVVIGSAAARAVTLPTTAFLAGQGVFIKRSGANNVVVTASSGQIDGAANFTIANDLESVLFVRAGAGLVLSASFFVAAAFGE